MAGRLTVVALTAMLIATTTSSVVAVGSDGGSTDASATPELLVDVVQDDTFELSITTPRTTWVVAEPIEINATLRYVGPDPKTVVTGSGSGIVGFGIEQIDGPIDTSPSGSSAAGPTHSPSAIL